MKPQTIRSANGYTIARKANNTFTVYHLGEISIDHIRLSENKLSYLIGCDRREFKEECQTLIEERKPIEV